MRPADAGLSPKDKASIKMHAIVLLQSDAAGGEAGQQRAVFGANGRGGVPDLQVRRGALQQGRLQEAGGGEGIHRSGGDAAAVLRAS